MRRVLIAVVVAALMVSSGAMAGSQWNNNQFDADANAFDVTFEVFNNGQPVNGWYYYEWTVALNTIGQPHYTWDSPPDVYDQVWNSNVDGPQYQITSIRGFAFDLPGSASTQIVDGGAYRLGTPAVDLGWNFQPNATGRDGVNPGTGPGGSWSGSNEYLYPDDVGSFSAGIWSNVGFDLGDWYPVQIHVNTPDQGDTYFVRWGVELTENREPPPPPPPTPELSTWALLACTAIAGLGLRKRRKL